MSILNFACLFSKISTSKRRLHEGARPRPSFETLEERCVLSSPGQVIAPGITLFNADIPFLKPEIITSGSDGALWFNGELSSEIGRISTAGDIAVYSNPDSQSITDVALGTDGAIWFTDVSTSQIGRIAPDGVYSFFPVKDESGNPVQLDSLALGSNGEIWFTFGHRFGEISSSGAITLFQQQTQGEIGALTTGPDGNLWFTEISGKILGKITPTGTITEYTFESNGTGPDTFAEDITAGPDGNLWFTIQGDNQIGELTSSGALTLFNLPADLIPRYITTGPDGALWFTADHSVGRITTTGVVSQFSVSDDVSNFAITTGPDGDLWFTTWPSNPGGDYEIGQMDPTALGSGASVPVSATQGNLVTSPVASVTLPTPAGATATIDWGDGQTSPGTLSPNGSGGYLVSANLDYALPGSYPITVTVLTATGVQLTIPSTVQVAASPDGEFVTGLYHQLLGRVPEARGASSWISQLNGGTSRAQIALEIEYSLEGRNRLVDQLYVRYLGRHADPGGLSAFSSMLGTGGTLEEATAVLLSSQEFLDDSGGTTSGFLNALYQDVLSRNIDPGTLTALEQQLSTAPSLAARYQIAQAVVSSPEAAQKQIQSDYLAILHRSADAAGMAAWSNLRAQGISEEVVRAGLLGSDEFLALVED